MIEFFLAPFEMMIQALIETGEMIGVAIQVSLESWGGSCG